jgi:hypothetical protein
MYIHSRAHFWALRIHVYLLWKGAYSLYQFVGILMDAWVLFEVVFVTYV